MDEFDDKWEVLVRKMHHDFPEQDVDRLVYLARRTHLDPLAKQLYATKRNTRDGDNWIVKVSMECTIDGLRLVAQRTGEYLGQKPIEWCAKNGRWVDVWLDLDNAPHAARASVYRARFLEPLSRVALYESFVQRVGKGADRRPGAQWATMPEHMLAKVAEALALRAAFPQEMSGIYLAEEMDQSENEPAPAPSKPKARTLADVRAGARDDMPIAEMDGEDIALNADREKAPPNGSRVLALESDEAFTKMLGELIALGKDPSTDVEMRAWCKQWAVAYRALPVRSGNAKLANQAMRKAASNCGIEEQQIRDWLDAYSAKDVGGEAGA